MSDIFELIDKEIERSLLVGTHQRAFEYNLPRQCGASTFLIRKTISDIDNGKRVLVLGSLNFIKLLQASIYGKQIDKLKMIKYNSLKVNEDKVIYHIKGQSFDNVYIDLPSFYLVNKQKIYEEILPQLTEEAVILGIDTGYNSGIDLKEDDHVINNSVLPPKVTKFMNDKEYRFQSVSGLEYRDITSKWWNKVTPDMLHQMSADELIYIGNVIKESLK